MKIRLTVSVAALALALGCSAPKQKLFIYNWSDYMPESVLDRFEAQHNCDIVYDLFASNEEMYAKLKAGATGYDICFPSGDYVSIMARNDMLLPIDKARVPNLKHVDPLVVSKIRFDPGLTHSVPYVMGGSGIAVNKKYVKEYDQSWEIFAREDLKGRMTMLDDMREVMGAALRTLGFSVNSTDTAQLRQAREKVATWQKNLLRYDSDAFGKAFAAGEVYVVQCYAENVFLALEPGQEEDVDFFIPREGGSAYIDNMVILKNSRNPDLAHTFVNYIHDPKVYAEIADSLALPSSNTAASDIRTVKPNYQIAQLKDSELKEDLGEHVELYDKIWQELRVGK